MCETIPKDIIINLLKSKNEDKILKAAREKDILLYKETGTR